MKINLFSVLRNQKGATAALIAVTLPLLLGIGALTVDVGAIYLARAQLANAADAAALAGALELPDKPDSAVATAESFAQLNGKPGDSILSEVAAGDNALKVTVGRDIDLFFARIWSQFSKGITASATAEIMTYAGGNNAIVPFGIVKQPLVYGSTYKLKVGAGSGYDGNFRALALGGTGASNYESNIANGYKGTFKVGDWVLTETGDMTGPTVQGVNERLSRDSSATFDTVQEGSSRIVIAPIIDSFDVSGRSDVQIVGFAAFFLEGCGKKGNDNYVYGKFRQMVLPGDISSTVDNYGLYGVRLAQ